MTAYGLAELARRAGVKPRTLAGYLARGKCPEPTWRFECGPVWVADDVKEWLEAREARVERIIDEAREAHLARVRDVFEQRYMPDPRETARRNVHNGRLRRRFGPGEPILAALEQPTVKQEVWRAAESVVSRETDPDRDRPSAVRWALELRDRRAVNRTGDPEGIPF